MDTKDNSLEKLGKDYSGYLDFPDLTGDQIKQLESSILAIFARSDELSAILETCETDTHKITQDVLPLLSEHSNQLEKTFYAIDKLVALMELLKNSTYQLERKIETAEESDPSTVTLKKVLNVFTSLPVLGIEKERAEAVNENIQLVNVNEYFVKLRQDINTL
eukprot:TRINITY_DN1626_c0_g2_i1.p1 TRINITY_DN1626_c0_g2~~TRINITY_DN1626_c0_g2_i1.p1  ORF type:complete len:163 (-),score=28.11 TRINITY_DN1626_c0_g2_i1:176-664(-)